MELRDLVLDSPERARFFCTVRAAISLAREDDAPRGASLDLLVLPGTAALREFGHLGGSGSYLWWAALNNRGVMTTGAWSAEEP